MSLELMFLNLNMLIIIIINVMNDYDVAADTDVVFVEGNDWDINIDYFLMIFAVFIELY